MRKTAMLSYRTILITVTVFSVLSIAGMGEIRASLGFAILFINVFTWCWPRIDKWNKARNKDIAAGQHQLDVGNYPEAEKALELAAEKAQGRSVAVRQSILLMLAEARRKQDKLDEAGKTIKVAMELTPNIPGKGSAYANCLEALALVEEDRGNYPEMQNLLRESVAIEQAQPRPNLAVIAKRSQKLALAHHKAGDHETAASQFARALELHEQAFGADHVETAHVLTEAGAALQEEGNHAEALRRLERALELKEKALGADAPEVTQSLRRLALSYEQSGRMDLAAAQLERMLLLRQRQVGSNEGELAEVYSHLARVNLLLGRLARAEDTAQSAVLILERKPSVELAQVLECLAKIYERSDRPAEAATANERAQSVWRTLGISPSDPARRRQALV